ncbi:MAG: PEBP family protein [Alphaproteobacteria bacterium]|nr:PEBP family protein [Alphaproteobacteria bacterium]
MKQVQPNTATKTAFAMVIAAAILSIGGLQSSAQDTSSGEGPNASKKPTRVIADIWVDNWFVLHVNGSKVIEDSVPITTERSFNAEEVAFSSDFPMTLAFEFRDFMENATGLEYINSRRQQMGDGGAIAQFRDAESGDLLSVTNGDWRCLVVQHAPNETSCARERQPRVDTGACTQTTTAIPEGWTSSSFDDRNWPSATVYSAGTVRPKGGYDRVSWSPAAQFIWGGDLERDNVVLCRATVAK